MYSFTEIALVFSNCTTKEECGQARGDKKSLKLSVDD